MTSFGRFAVIGSHRRVRTIGLLVATFSVVAALATACGGGGSASDASGQGVAHLGTTTTTSDAGAAAGAGASAGGGANPETIGADLMKFSACMRSHGVPSFPNPVISNSGVSLHITPAVAGGPGPKSSPQFRQAAQDCRKYAPAGPTSQNITAAQQADYLKAAQCMRAHGINGFPDPDFSGGGVRFPLPQGMNANTTQFEAARHKCQNLIPNGLPYSATDENP